MKLSLIISFVSTLLIVSCSKSGSGGVVDDGGGGVTGPIAYDTLAPVITITNPAEGETLKSGTTYNITGNLTDDHGLYQGYVLVTNDANGVEIKKQNYEIHGFLRYNFTVPLTPSVTATANYTVTVFFEDHGNNKTTRTVKVKVIP